MGLFSSKRVVYVSSVVYNLAGDELERPSYLKAVTVRSVMSPDRKLTTGQKLTQSYLQGPGMKLRSYFRWANRNLNALGMPSGSLTPNGSINYNVLQEQLPRPAGQSVVINFAEVDKPDYMNWAEQYMLANHPTLISTTWSADFNESTKLITIKFADGTTASFTATNYDPNGNYLYCVYTYSTQAAPWAVETGVDVPVDSWDDMPETTTYVSITDASSNNFQFFDKTTETVVEYSDGTPGSTETDVVEEIIAFPTREARYEKTEYYGPVGNDAGEDFTMDQKSILIMNQLCEPVVLVRTVVTEEELEEGVIKTTTVTTTEYVPSYSYKYRIDTQFIPLSGFSDPVGFLYKMGGSNAALNNIVQPDKTFKGEFFPAIPVRIENKFLSDSYKRAAFEEAKKAYKKSIGGSWDELIANIKENDNLSDIDHAFIVFGVSANVKENACRKYMYRFFQNLKSDARYDYEFFSTYKQRYEAHVASVEAYEEYKQDRDHPIFNHRAPKILPHPGNIAEVTNQLVVRGMGSVDNIYDTRIYWRFVQEFTGVGKGRTGAKPGDCWLVKAGEMPLGSGTTGSTLWLGEKFVEDTIDLVRIYWQTGENTYKYLILGGFEYRNYVYGGKYVSYTLSEALDDDEESGFIVPLHYNTMKQLSIVDYTQMTTACCFVVFNCYVIKKIRWYQRGIFKFLFAIVFAIVAAVFTGGAGFGLLGANLAVGSTLGFTGLTAAIVGSVVNAVAAMLLTTVIQSVAGGLFGDKFGALIGAILGFVIFNAITSFTNLGSFDWGSLMRVDNLMKLTDALANGYAGMVQGQANAMYAESQGIMSDYESRRDEIADLFAQNVGYANRELSPLGYATNGQPLFTETRDTFLTRTLMTGSDIAELSHGLLNDFADLTLKLPNPFDA